MRPAYDRLELRFCTIRLSFCCRLSVSSKQAAAIKTLASNFSVAVERPRGVLWAFGVYALICATISMLTAAEAFAFPKDSHVRDVARILRSIGYDVNQNSIGGMSVRAKAAIEDAKNAPCL